RRAIPALRSLTLPHTQTGPGFDPGPVCFWVAPGSGGGGCCLASGAGAGVAHVVHDDLLVIGVGITIVVEVIPARLAIIQPFELLPVGNVLHVHDTVVIAITGAADAVVDPVVVGDFIMSCHLALELVVGLLLV